MEYDYSKDGRIAGQIEIFTGTKPPVYLLACNGALVQRKQYPVLFQAIGTTFGAGDGSTTFKLPTIADLATNVKYYIRAH